MANNMVLTYLHFRILEFPLTWWCIIIFPWPPVHRCQATHQWSNMGFPATGSSAWCEFATLHEDWDNSIEYYSRRNQLSLVNCGCLGVSENRVYPKIVLLNGKMITNHYILRHLIFRQSQSKPYVMGTIIILGIMAMCNAYIMGL